jgi:hypothetical protein
MTKLRGHFFTAVQDFVPKLEALIFAQIKMSGYTEVALKKLAARKRLEAVESVSQEFEIRVFEGQT